MLQVLLTLLLAPLLRLLTRHPASPPRRVLVVQVAKIGDMACTTPLLRELARGLPGARVTVLAGPAASPETPMTVSAGLGIANFPFEDHRGFWRWVDLCDQGGVDSIWQSDRIISTDPQLEALSVMAALAGGTRRRR